MLDTKSFHCHYPTKLKQFLCQAAKDTDMLKSMTAYGRSTVVSPLGRISVEIQSVNRKHLEINSILPSEFFRFDPDIKKWISEVIGRGQVTIKIRTVFEKASPLTVIPNLPLARQILKAWHELADDLRFSIDDKDRVRVLSGTENLLLYDDLQNEEDYKQLLHQAVDQALKQLLVMKSTEGKALYLDISGRLSALSAMIAKIAEKAPGATTRYREKLQERIQEALGASIENEERILREVCVFADKIDIAEELTRFDSHLKQMELQLQSKGQSVGKTMEFIVQEMNREINTIASKSSDADVSRLVIEIKTELERIREQIQNIE
jgi:uncharacterized protein (TIGR00255 family)